MFAFNSSSFLFPRRTMNAVVIGHHKTADLPQKEYVP